MSEEDSEVMGKAQSDETCHKVTAMILEELMKMSLQEISNKGLPDGFE